MSTKTTRVFTSHVLDNKLLSANKANIVVNVMSASGDSAILQAELHIDGVPAFNFGEYTIEAGAALNLEMGIPVMIQAE